MTNPLFFDNDCISAFLWVEKQSILTRLYPNKIVIPQPVYNELSFPGIQHLKMRVDSMINNGDVEIRHIQTNTEAYDFYFKMTQNPDINHKIIGNGEAACLALAKSENGIIASNNLKDIRDYIEEYSLKHITTGDIMIEAYQKGIITEAQGNMIWANMLAKRRRIGARSFSEYLKSKNLYNQ